MKLQIIGATKKAKQKKENSYSGFHPEIFLRGGKIRVLKMRWGSARQRAI